MYPFETWRAATDALWEDVRSAMPELPPLAPWGADVHALWHDPGLVVSQTCGWPLITELDGRVRTVGAFRYRTDDWMGDHYRSVIVARDGGAPVDLTVARAAVNSTDSLSGWVSLMWYVERQHGGSRPGPVTITDSHLVSLEAVRDGVADIASIDAITYAHAVRDRPDLLRNIAAIGHGPRVPCLPVVAGRDAGDGWIADLRTALDAAAARRTDTNATLMIDGFTPLDTDAYRALGVLAPAPH